MALKHNKKRNSGMISEFFANQIAKAVVSANKKRIQETKQIWDRYSATGTELNKELQLFEALRSRKFGSKEIAFDLLTKVRKASKRLNVEKLEREKTALIREVNERFKDFFDHEIEDYVDLASIQIFLNYHASRKLNESTINPAIFEIEDKIVSYMCEKKDEKNKERLDKIISGNTQKEVDGLVVNIMREKLNKKFGETLNKEQRDLLQKHVYGNNQKEVSKKLTEIKEEAIRLLENEISKSKKKQSSRDKFVEIKTLIENDYADTSKVNDSNITFYMMVSNLNEELREEK